MEHFTAHRLRFECEVITADPVERAHRLGHSRRVLSRAVEWLLHESPVATTCHGVPAGGDVPGGVSGEHARSEIRQRGQRAQTLYGAAAA